MCGVCGCPAARVTVHLPLPSFRRRRDACSGSPPSCPAVPCIRPLHIFSFLPSTSEDAIRRLQRLLGLVRGCPALLQLRISLPPLDEVGRDGLGPRAPLHPHRVPPLSLAVGGMLRPKRITGRSERIERSEPRVPLVGRGLMHALYTLCPCIARRELRAWMAMGSPSCTAPPRSLVTY